MAYIIRSYTDDMVKFTHRYISPDFPAPINPEPHLTERNTMNDKKTLSYYRDRFAVFARDEEEGRSDVTLNDRFNTHRVTVGRVSFKTRQGEKTLDVDMHSEKSHHTSCICKTNDGDFFISITPNWLESPNLPAIIAHELGHLASGHLSKNVTLTLDRNTRKTKGYYDYLTQLGDVIDNTEYDLTNIPADIASMLVEVSKRERDYTRSLFFGLERGGVFVQELEADLAGAKYVGSEAMLKVHGENLMFVHHGAKSRVGVETELRNRLCRLSGLGTLPTRTFTLEMYV